MTENAIAKEIVDAAFRVHTTLGPGLLESVYQMVLAYELGRRGSPRGEPTNDSRWSRTVSALMPGSEPIWWWKTRSSWKSNLWNCLLRSTKSSF